MSFSRKTIGLAILAALALTALAFWLWPSTDSLQDRREALLEAGYTYAEAERLAEEDLDVTNIPGQSTDTPLTLRLPQSVDPPDKFVADLLLQDINSACQATADDRCQKNLELPSGYFVWARVDDIFKETETSAEAVSWQCLRNSDGRFMIRGPLFSELVLEEEQWSVQRILDARPQKLSPAEKESVLFVRGQLPVECAKR